ncbi:general substrate transporter [Thelephora ganbajun]|uniref:General substrate transporter n=1 Tax=Thelephora ganbajun TaxID=370292 RepID=A0ACB6ZBF2_THEGA|nr:general substrate transporter [Thelephora ganbajun]
MIPREQRSFTPFGIAACAWILVTSFQYGYHISALNQIQVVLTCKVTSDDDSPLGLPNCIPMTDAQFSALTSVFSVGGLIGSAGANVVMDSRGRRGALRISAVLTALGASLMAIASGYAPLVIGRLLIGISAGVGICLTPIFIAEVSPARIRGKVGVFTQFSIVVGIMITQLIGFKLAVPTAWRYVLFLSSLTAIAQFLVSPAMVESPVWAIRSGDPQSGKAYHQKLWKNCDSRSPDEDPLLAGDLDNGQEHAVSVLYALKTRELRLPLTIVSLAMVSQQISGAVLKVFVQSLLYYSNEILSNVIPGLGPYISILVTVVNVVMTFPPIFLIERVGRKKLLTASVFTAVAAHIFIGFGLNNGFVAMCSVAMLVFIMAFASGLGPVPFIMLPEVSPPYASLAVSALSSIALSMNWVCNFIVGLSFLPLRNFLSGGEAEYEGRVFYLFGTLLLVSYLVLYRLYK